MFVFCVYGRRTSWQIRAPCFTARQSDGHLTQDTESDKFEHCDHSFWAASPGRVCVSRSAGSAGDPAPGAVYGGRAEAGATRPHRGQWPATDAAGPPRRHGWGVGVLSWGVPLPAAVAAVCGWWARHSVSSCVGAALACTTDCMVYL